MSSDFNTYDATTFASAITLWAQQHANDTMNTVSIYPTSDKKVMCVNLPDHGGMHYIWGSYSRYDKTYSLWIRPGMPPPMNNDNKSKKVIVVKPIISDSLIQEAYERIAAICDSK